MVGILSLAEGQLPKKGCSLEFIIVMTEVSWWLSCGFLHHVSGIFSNILDKRTASIFGVKTEAAEFIWNIGKHYQSMETLNRAVRQQFLRSPGDLRHKSSVLVAEL